MLPNCESGQVFSGRTKVIKRVEKPRCCLMVSRRRSRARRADLPRCAVGLCGVCCAVLLVLGGCQAASSGGAGGAEGDSGDPADQSIGREIEEADIVKYQSGYFYLANRYRGLRIIDARTIERAELVGGVSIQGRGVELIVDDGRAYVVTTADFYTCAGEPVSFDDAELANDYLHPDYEGSRLTVADVSDPAAPFELAHFDLEGYVTATRRVGEVLYAAGNMLRGPESEDDAGDENDDGQDDEPQPPSTTTAAVTVGEDGEAMTFAISPALVRGELSVSGADPEGFIQITVSDGDTQGTLAGIPGANAVSATVTADGDLADGAFTGVVSAQVKTAAIATQTGLPPGDLAVYRWDPALGYWVPAGTTFVGESEPTTQVGDFGYVLFENPEFHSMWAVVDSLGSFALGERAAEEITIEATDSAGGVVLLDPSQEAYAYGDVVTATAEPDSGYRFAGWTPVPATAEVLDDGALRFVVTEDLQLGAEFAWIDPADYEPYVFVVSVNIADPQDIRLIERVEEPGEALDIHVTGETMYVLGDDPDAADTTRVIQVDISDPGGAIVTRKPFRVPGYLENRFYADEHDGVLRVITEDRSVSSVTPLVALYVYDLSDPDNVQRLADLPIEVGETLRTVRFDGPRGYAVTFRQVDPLFVLDLADPADPAVVGELEVPGWSTHLVPLDDRLVGVGFDDQAGFRPAVALYDVSEPSRPQQLDRIVLGEMWTSDTTSEATVDEKALRVLEDEELILLPISSYDPSRLDYVDSLQLIDLRRFSLGERGFLRHQGLIRRADVLDGRLWVLSDEAFQVADIGDRDQPEGITTVVIMSEQDLLDAGLQDCADSARFHGFPVEEPFIDGVFFPGGPLACGAVGLLPFGLCAAGLVGLRVRRGNRR